MYWLFTEEQLKTALTEWLESITSQEATDDEKQVLRDGIPHFLRSAAAVKHKLVMESGGSFGATPEPRVGPIFLQSGPIDTPASGGGR